MKWCYTVNAKLTKYWDKYVIFYRRTIFCVHYYYVFKFEKNADSTRDIGIDKKMYYFNMVSLATIGVCIFRAATSVAAFFIYGEKKYVRVYH